MIELSSVAQNTINYMPLENNKNHLEVANKLIEEARLLANLAEKELDHGTESMYLLMEHKTIEFKSIAEWHYRRCLEKAASSRTKYLEAQKQLTNPKRLEYCHLKITEIDEIFLKATDLLEKITKKTRETVIGRNNK